MEFDRTGVNALMEITARPDLVFVSGQGSWLVDHTGKRYLDFVQGWAVNSLGHCPPVVIEALQKQASVLINPSPAFYNQPAIDFAKQLVAASCFDRVFFANSGAEANEGAIKLARKWGRLHRNGAYKIITFEHGFHGRTLATMSASGKSGWDSLFAPQVDGFPKAQYNDLASVKALIDDDTVAIMLEPVQGEGGVIAANKQFMQGLRDLSQQHGILLIVDEVQTGMGRTGTLFAYQQASIKPDIMTLAKGIGAGVPLAALCATEAVSCFEHGDQGGTYNGNPLMAAVGLAVLNTIN
ncbi:MAG TPA: aminotransferase class III-fold pyridoxal phosphate-dependent enzyme, partial [Burkholderiaceae bacterium]|nr:aminotransferase class III-fold pyridoxal phosphate-dependent enzyme [Burkholderiaceae bacterium]